VIVRDVRCIACSRVLGRWVILDDRRQGMLPPRKGEQTMRQRCGPPRGGSRRIHKAWKFIQPAGGDAPANDVKRTDDAGQKIVEVMGDAAGKLPPGGRTISGRRVTNAKPSSSISDREEGHALHNIQGAPGRSS